MREEKLEPVHPGEVLLADTLAGCWEQEVKFYAVTGWPND